MRLHRLALAMGIDPLLMQALWTRRDQETEVPWAIPAMLRLAIYGGAGRN